jgi:hypothetical protein
MNDNKKFNIIINTCDNPDTYVIMLPKNENNCVKNKNLKLNNNNNDNLITFITFKNLGKKRVINNKKQFLNYITCFNKIQSPLRKMCISCFTYTGYTQEYPNFKNIHIAQFNKTIYTGRSNLEPPFKEEQILIINGLKSNYMGNKNKQKFLFSNHKKCRHKCIYFNGISNDIIPDELPDKSADYSNNDSNVTNKTRNQYGNNIKNFNDLKTEQTDKSEVIIIITNADVQQHNPKLGLNFAMEREKYLSTPRNWKKHIQCSSESSNGDNNDNNNNKNKNKNYFKNKYFTMNFKIIKIKCKFKNITNYLNGIIDLTIGIEIKIKIYITKIKCKFKNMAGYLKIHADLRKIIRETLSKNTLQKIFHDMTKRTLESFENKRDINNIYYRRGPG